MIVSSFVWTKRDGQSDRSIPWLHGGLQCEQCGRAVKMTESVQPSLTCC